MGIWRRSKERRREGKPRFSDVTGQLKKKGKGGEERGQIFLWTMAKRKKGEEKKSLQRSCSAALHLRGRTQRGKKERDRKKCGRYVPAWSCRGSRSLKSRRGRRGEMCPVPRLNQPRKEGREGASTPAPTRIAGKGNKGAHHQPRRPRPTERRPKRRRKKRGEKGAASRSPATNLARGGGEGCRYLLAARTRGGKGGRGGRRCILLTLLGPERKKGEGKRVPDLQHCWPNRHTPQKKRRRKKKRPGRASRRWLGPR